MKALARHGSSRSLGRRASSLPCYWGPVEGRTQGAVGWRRGREWRHTAPVGLEGAVHHHGNQLTTGLLEDSQVQVVEKAGDTFEGMVDRWRQFQD